MNEGLNTQPNSRIDDPKLAEAMAHAAAPSMDMHILEKDSAVHQDREATKEANNPSLSDDQREQFEFNRDFARELAYHEAQVWEEHANQAAEAVQVAQESSDEDKELAAH